MRGLKKSLAIEVILKVGCQDPQWAVNHRLGKTCTNVCCITEKVYQQHQLGSVAPVKPAFVPWDKDHFILSSDIKKTPSEPMFSQSLQAELLTN